MGQITLLSLREQRHKNTSCHDSILILAKAGYAPKSLPFRWSTRFRSLSESQKSRIRRRESSIDFKKKNLLSMSFFLKYASAQSCRLGFEWQLEKVRLETKLRKSDIFK